MIEKITIKNVASYRGAPVEIEKMTKFCFFYGANGSGKTTISRVIDNCDDYPTCSIDWKDGTRLQTLVYNRDFIEKTLAQAEGMPGVFTLGEDQVETRMKIERLEKELSTIGQLMSLQNDEQSFYENELTRLDDWIKDKCWKVKKNYESDFEIVFQGFHGSQAKFKDEILANKNNDASLESYDYLVNTHDKVFKEEISLEEKISPIDSGNIIKAQSSQIITKKIIGREDVDIASLIKELGASDWVKDGYENYFSAEKAICPFCQQQTTEAFAHSLREYFDRSYEDNLRELEEFSDNYRNQTETILKYVSDLHESRSSFLQTSELAEHIHSLKECVRTNLMKIEMKIKEPSRSIELKPIDSIVRDINILLGRGNESIDKHNETVDDIDNQREKLKKQVWKYIYEVTKDDVELYERKERTLNTKARIVESMIKYYKQEMDRNNKMIEGLRREITSIQPTIDSINRVLSSFNFTGFKLDKATEGEFYTIVRPGNPDNAKNTLSEGEISFVTFLYFYYLIQGTLTETDSIKDLVVVFDDPVSSLDNDVMFVVSSLIKEIMAKTHEGTNNVKQVIVLTHNVFFHREVTHLRKKMEKKASYWVVSKTNNESRIRYHEDNNPIKSSYQLLWDEYQDKTLNVQMLPNVMRRILESYFKILGDIDLDNISNEFNGPEKQIYESLIYWSHAGSHKFNIFEDANSHTDEVTAAKYRDVFEKIFIESGHGAHYNMMMGITSS